MYSFLSWWKGYKIVYITLITIHLCLLVCLRSGRIYGTVVSLNDWWKIKQLLFYLSRLIDLMLPPLKFHSFIIGTVNIYDYIRTFIAHKNRALPRDRDDVKVSAWWRTTIKHNKLSAAAATWMCISKRSFHVYLREHSTSKAAFTRTLSLSCTGIMKAEKAGHVRV